VIKGQKIAVNDDHHVATSDQRAQVIPQHLLDEAPQKMVSPNYNQQPQQHQTKTIPFDPTNMDPKDLGIDVRGGPVKIVHLGPDGKSLGVQHYENGRHVGRQGRPNTNQVNHNAPSYLPTAQQAQPKVSLTKKGGKPSLQQGPKKPNANTSEAYRAYGAYPGVSAGVQVAYVAPGGVNAHCAAYGMPPGYGMPRGYGAPPVYVQGGPVYGYGAPCQQNVSVYPAKKMKKKKKKGFFASSSSSSNKYKAKKYKMHVHHH